MILNREKGAPPLYSQVETILRTDIEHGKYNKGDSFPTENMLMEEYQVSRVTIRQAMTALSQAGYIMSRRGIGTEVTYEKIDEHAPFFRRIFWRGRRSSHSFRTGTGPGHQVM